MAGLGIGIAFMGYWVMYYGVTQVQGGNWGFLDLGVPSRWAAAAATPTDSGRAISSQSIAKSATSAAAGAATAGGIAANPSVGGEGLGLKVAGTPAGGVAGGAVNALKAIFGL